MTSKHPADPEIAKIRAANGGELAPEAVVDAARDPKSPPHANFEWDDHVAAEAYRVDEARDLIGAIDRPSP